MTASHGPPSRHDYSAATGCQCETCRAHVFNPSRLVAARKRRAMSEWALATALELSSVAALGRIENGKRVPSDDLVERFVQVLGFPVGFFYAHDLPTLTAEMIS